MRSRFFSKPVAIALLLATVLATTMIVGSVFPVDEKPIVARTLFSSANATVNVTVTDDFGRPMELAIVGILGNSTTWDTNANGTALIVGLTAEDSGPGTAYNFTASKTGYRSIFTMFWIYSNRTNNITLAIEGGVILGTVSSASGPISGANVSIPSALGYYNRTGPDGRYQLSGIPGGLQAVTATAPGYDNRTEIVNLAVAGFYVRDFVLSSQTGSISGFILSEVTLWPLYNASVSVKVGQATITVSSDPNGSYDITSLPEGTYTVTATLDGFNSNMSAPIALERGESERYVNLTLREKPTKLYGVVKAGTLLLPGVNVTIVGTPFQNTSDYEGSYEIQNVTAGIYTVTASIKGYIMNTTRNVVILAGRDTVLNINLKEVQGGQLRGKVLASDTNEALSVVRITISSKDSEPQTVFTNVNGEFAFTGLASGNYTIQFLKDGYKPMEVTRVQVGAENITEKTFTIEPLRHGFTGFIFGFDMAHSMMILGLFLTIVILAMAVYLRIRTFQSPESTPAVFDEEEGEEVAPVKGDEESQEESGGEKKNIEES